MSPLPAHMTDRWRNRAEPGPGQGTLYWHILMGDHPEAQDLAQDAQERLADIPGLHITPTEWLHITTHVAGPTEEITDAQQHDMLAMAQGLLTKIPPVNVTLDRILYHPEAIAVAVQPTDPLARIREAIQEATLKVTGSEGSTEGPEPWTPHMTIAYSETDQPAGPLITALGRELPTRRIIIDTVTLVDQRGAERRWDWHPVGNARLLGHR
ncbi:2'-5' RNA ligase family protein [Actinomadura sp. KC345]|uniref:2'-5' RNA ligase family protein n=1 Tax=Actinomadura sp. KC345 TaxID=2530371 RepID=UPI001052B2A9|nr:2'-5' RNA ligase family protein [Actinomadura sp. KC345]TDC38067.1 2'-5' RNA ligase family protein [Actinomadura sp. KC345]